MATDNAKTASEKISAEIIRLKYLSSTAVVVKIKDMVDFLEDVNNDLNQPEPEPDET